MTAEPSQRVLVLAPTGRDGGVICQVLDAAGIHCHRVGEVSQLRGEVARGAGAMILAGETITPHNVQELAGILSSQPPWSDLPVVLAIPSGATQSTNQVHALGLPAGTITVLERPIRVVTLVTAIQSALRLRKRQYDLRDLLEELRRTVGQLNAERGGRERFVSLLAHDLRGPLSAAMMAARVLALRPERIALTRELAFRIERNLERADRMIRDLLDANRIRAGRKLPLSLQRCDLVEIAKQVKEEFEPLAGDRLVIVGAPRLEGIWGADELRRALWNLVSNALKYGDPEAPVEIRLGQQDEWALLSVHNQGQVIPPEVQRTLFQPFARAPSAEAGQRGWGLGLTLVLGCADAHGGTVSVSSTPGEGTTFTLRIPFDARPFQGREEAPSGLAPAPAT